MTGSAAARGHEPPARSWWPMPLLLCPARYRAPRPALPTPAAQLQYLYLAAARTFLADQPDVLRLAEARATRADPLGGMDAQEEVQACFLLMLQEPSRRRSLLLSASRRNLADMGAAAGGGGSLKELDAAAEGGGSGLGARAPAAENGSDAGGEPLPAVAPPGL